MKALSFTIVYGLLALTTQAQQDAQVGAQHSKPAVAARFGAEISARALKEQLYILAAPSMEGRETATAGQRKAAAYIIDQFSGAGLQPGANGKWEQYFYLYQDTLNASTITVNSRAYRFGKDYYVSIKDARDQALRAPHIVFGGYGISTQEYDDYKGMNVANQVVLILPDEPRKNDTAFLLSGNRRPTVWSDLEKKVEAAAARQVGALLIVHESATRMEQVLGDRLRKTGIYMHNDNDAPAKGPNVYFISPQMAAAMLGVSKAETLLQPATVKKLKPSLIRKPVNVQFRKGILELRSSNVLAYIEGTDKKQELVFVTAHYDHLGVQDSAVFHGADDDGSGTVAVLQIAAAFARAAKAGYGPRRSMVFMAVSGEEKGLLGSKFYTEHPVYPLQQTVADLNIDMIGRIDPMHEKDSNYVYVIGDDKLSSELRGINERANAAFTRLHLDYKYNDPDDPNRFYYRSDHYMFAQHNIPVIFYFNGTHADYHRITDTVEKIDYPLLARRAQLVFYTAWEIANRENRLKVDRHEQ